MSNNDNKSCASTSINWARRHLAKPTSNLHKISIFEIRLIAYFSKK